MQGVPHGFKAEGDNLPGALRIVAGEFDGGFRQRQKQGVAKGAVRLAGNDSNLLIVFYVQIVPDDFVMQLHRF